MTDALLWSIEDSGKSFNELERESGVLRQSLMKFVAGERSLRLDKADQLAEYFGLNVVTKKAK